MWLTVHETPLRFLYSWSWIIQLILPWHTLLIYKKKKGGGHTPVATFQHCCELWSKCVDWRLLQCIQGLVEFFSSPCCWMFTKTMYSALWRREHRQEVQPHRYAGAEWIQVWGWAPKPCRTATAAYRLALHPSFTVQKNQRTQTAWELGRPPLFKVEPVSWEAMGLGQPGVRLLAAYLLCHAC